MGLKSRPLGSIMPARKRSVAMFALCGCPLVRTPLLTTPSNGLIPKFEINEYTDNFVATVIRTLFLKKYGFPEMCTQKVLKKELVPLPATSDRKPDWVYMESYMKRVMDESEKRIECLKMDLE